MFPDVRGTGAGRIFLSHPRIFAAASKSGAYHHLARKEVAMAKRRAKQAEGVDVDGGEDQPTEAERVRAEIERVRGRLGVDPTLPRHWLAGAWSVPIGGIEEDEAELADVLADCLSVGLHLGDAVASWSCGGLAGGGDADDDLEADRDREALTALILSTAGQPRARRRITIR
jgi:hypothetical protein